MVFELTLAAFLTNLLVGTAISVASSLAVRFLTPRSNNISAARTGAAARQTIRSEIVNARWILGESRLPGVLCYWGANGAEARMGLILAEGPCDSIQKVWIDGHVVQLERTASSDGDLLVPVAGSKYSGKVEIREYFAADGSQGSHLRQTETTTVPPGSPNPLYDGYDPNDPNSQIFSGDFGIYGPDPQEFTEHATYVPTGGQREFLNYSTLWPRWTTNHQLEGVSWVYIKLTQPEYGQDIEKRFWARIPNIEFLVKGLKFTWPGQTTPTWTENAAAIRYWWETQRRGRPTSAYDLNDFTAAYNLCEEEVDVTNGGTDPLPVGYESYNPISKRYSYNGAISSGDDVQQIEDQMDAAWAGEVVEVNGNFLFRPGSDNVVATLTLEDKDFIEPPAIQPWAPIQGRFNTVNVRLIQSKSHDNLALSLPEYIDQDALTRDGVKRPTAFAYAFVNDPIAGGRLQVTNVLRSRESLRIRCVVMPGENFLRATLKPTDRVLITNAEHGLTNFRCAVEQVRLREDWSVELGLREDKPNTYVDVLVLPPLKPRMIRLPQEDLSPNVEGVVIDEIAGIAMDGTTIIHLVISWTPKPVSQTEFQIRQKSSDPNDPDMYAWEDGISTGKTGRLPGAVSDQIYEIRLRHYNSANVAGDWTELFEHTVGGDLIPPGPPTSLDVDSRPIGFRATWTNPTDVDFASICVYASKGSDLDAASLLATVSADYYEHRGLDVGDTYNVWIRAKDRSGNLSLAAGPEAVIPTPATGDSTKITVGIGAPTATSPPDPNEGDIYIQSTGEYWNFVNGAWDYTGIDIAPDGNVVHAIMGAGPPSNTLGSNGDIAISVDMGTIWVKSGGSWSEEGDLTGPEGVEGPVGVQGAQGIDGDKGNPGIKGPLGVQGPQGIDGDKGNPGIKGPLGVQGPQGIDGGEGDKGNPGIMGVEGPQGIDGGEGDKGNPGIMGVEGPQGIDGMVGPVGGAGPKGVIGIQGPAGTQGESGDQVFQFYTNAPPDTDPADLIPLVETQSGVWTTASGFFYYGDATQVP